VYHVLFFVGVEEELPGLAVAVGVIMVLQWWYKGVTRVL
jgi:hypothetical protein